MSVVPQVILNGLIIGGTYALMAVGLTFLLGFMDLVNMAHGELYMLGAYFTFFFIVTAGLPHVIQSTGSMFSVFLTDGPVRDYADAQRTSVPAYAALFHAMLDQGVHLPPSAYEAWFVSSSHDDRAVQQVLDALPAAARAAAQTHGATS